MKPQKNFPDAVIKVLAALIAARIIYELFNHLLCTN